MKRYGLEAEYLFAAPTTIHSLNGNTPPWVTKEFFDIMVEVVTDVHTSRGAAVEELQHRVEVLERLNGGVQLLPRATLPDDTAWSAAWGAVTSHTPYYQWVYEVACRQQGGASPFWLHPVGFHPNFSDTTLTEDQMVQAVNALRCLNFLFILVTANSPSRLHGCVSARSLLFPNRYPPFWQGAEHFREWISAEEAAGRIFTGKGRCWMACCPRLVDNDVHKPIERIELRSLDSGRDVPFETLGGCFELMERVIDASSGTASLPSLHSELHPNDQAVARLGRKAEVMLHGKAFSVIDIAREWCHGIPSLERVLEEGSPAEQLLRN